MRHIISMPAAIIAALGMLAVFDSAAGSDEQAQLLDVRETSGGLNQKTGCTRGCTTAAKRVHVNIAKGTDAFRHRSSLAERYQSTR